MDYLKRNFTMIAAPRCGSYKGAFAFSFSFGRRLTLVVASAILASRVCCYGEAPVISGADSWNPRGLFCFKTVKGEDTLLHLVKVDGDKFELLFATNTCGPIHPPICFAECAIAANVSGVVCKFDLKGGRVFGKIPTGIDGGVCFQSGKINATHIFLTEARWDTRKKAWKHKLHLISISGSEPNVDATFNIVQPTRVVRVLDDIVVVGPKGTRDVQVQKFKIPAKIDAGLAGNESQGVDRANDFLKWLNTTNETRSKN